MTTKFFQWAAVMVISLPLTLSFAQTSTADETKNFLTESALERLADIEEGKLVQQHSASPYMQEYGKRMVTDHTMLLEKLKELAALKNVELPQTMSEQKKTDLKALFNEKGEKFDFKFVRMIKMDRKRDIDLFKRAAKSEDAEVSAFAKQYLPLLQEHLEGIKEVRKSEDQAARLSAIPQE